MKEDLTNIEKLTNVIATRNIISGRFLVLGFGLILLACNQRKELIDQSLYEGPLSSMDSTTTLISDSGRVVMNLTSIQQNNFENGDNEWSQGFHIEWYNSEGQTTGYFSANYVYFTKSDNLYKAQGNVVVRSNVNQDELNTEELFWDKSEGKFYTNKFVTITSDDEVHTGEGMESNQDFTEYKILKPSGIFTLENDPNRQLQREISPEQIEESQ